MHIYEQKSLFSVKYVFLSILIVSRYCNKNDAVDLGIVVDFEQKLNLRS